MIEVDFYSVSEFALSNINIYVLGMYFFVLVLQLPSKAVMNNEQFYSSYTIFVKCQSKTNCCKLTSGYKGFQSFYYSLKRSKLCYNIVQSKVNQKQIVQCVDSDHRFDIFLVLLVCRMVVSHTNSVGWKEGTLWVIGEVIGAECSPLVIM